MEESNIYHQKHERIDRAIEAITLQIELLSSKCQMIGNKKNGQMDSIIEASTLLLQLSRSLNELIITKNALDKIEFNNQSKNAQNDINNIVFKGWT